MELLSSNGLFVTLAENGQQVLDLLQHHSFYDVLMDCQMPVMDGFAATRALRGEGVSTPIVALTANAMAGDRERCLAAGMDDYVSKPFQPELLYEKIHGFIFRS